MLTKVDRPNDSDLHQSSAATDQLLRNLPDAIVVVDQSGTIAQIHGQFTDVFGYRPEELLGESIMQLIPERFRGIHSGYVSMFFRSPHVRPMGGLDELSAVRKDGSEIAVDIMLSPLVTSEGSFVVAVIRDATERRKAKADLHRIAYFDPLTNLPNRHKMQHYLNCALSNFCDGLSCSVAIATLEIEHFQKINDAIGHFNGDALLKAVAHRLSSETPEGAKLFRVGGDEFSLVIPNCGDVRIIDEVVRRMFRRLEVPFNIDGRNIHIAAQAGIAISANHAASADDLIANASIALDGSKSDVTRNIRIFDPMLRVQAQARRKLDEELAQAFENGEFELFYQPQVYSATGKIAGAEALLRWRHPVRGLVGPGAFIGSLAEHPIVLEVGFWILHTAAKKAARWHDMGFRNFRIGVNLFPMHFYNDTLLRDVEKVLTETGLPAPALELEITEDIVLNSGADIIAPLKRLSEMGVGIAFDDFGTGYASLSCLTAYPLSRIKIDRSFLKNVPGTGKNTAIVPALIALAHQLGLNIIAEGVENAEQLNYLAECGCEEIQGFLFAKPMPEQDFVDYLKQFDAEAALAEARLAG